MINLWQKKQRLLAFTAILLGSQACYNEKDFEFERLQGIRLSPSLAVPLLHGSLTIEDLLPPGENKNVVYDENQLIHLVYDDTLYTSAIRDQFLLKPLQLKESYYSPAETVITEGDYIAVEEREYLSLDLGEADIDEIRLIDGILELKAYSNIDADVELLITLPEVKRAGTPLSLRLTLPAGSNSYQYASTDLNGYNIDLATYGAGNNLIPVDIIAVVPASGETTNLNISDFVEVNLDIKEMNFSLMTGDFGQLEVDIPREEIPLDIFDQLFTNTQFSLKEPKLSIDFLNSNGVPVQLEKKLLLARKGIESLAVETNPAVYFDLAYPSAPGRAAAISTLEINNVSEIIALAPEMIDYKFIGRLNAGQPTGGVNFLTDSSALGVILHADIPLWGYLEALSLSDTLEMALQSEDAMVDEAIIHAVIENEFPLGAEIQIYFTNERYDTFDSLFAEGPESLIPAAEVNSNGDVKEAGSFIKDIEIGSQRFEKILKATHMVVKGVLYTSRNADGTPVDVKIKSNQELNVQLGLRTNMDITVKQ